MDDEKRTKEQYVKELNQKISELEVLVEHLKQKEQMLRNNQVNLTAILNTAIDGIITINDHGTIETVNPATEGLFGYERNELLGKNVRVLTPEPYSGEHDTYLLNYLTTGEKKCIGETRERIAIRKDGEIFPIEMSLSEVRLSDGRLYTAIVRDITERKRLEEELLKAQKLESLSILASGIGHDFNNLLTAILGNISAARMLGSPGEEATGILSDAEQACIRAKGLIRQLTSFTKGAEPFKKTVSVPEFLREWVPFALRGLKASCDFSLADDLSPVDVDEVQMSQVINNLVFNADQAMPDGGTIKIRAENTEVAPTDMLSLGAGKYVRISISDEGSGVEDEDLKRIFDPFFTTKREGSSGLGLTITRSIIKNHGGQITVESESGIGSTFHIWLPASEKKSIHERARQNMRFMGTGKLLVMDDDKPIRKLLEWSLPRLGYEVWSAKDGHEAIDLYKKAKASGQPFKVVVIDLTVPGGLGGKDVIKRLREIDPDVKAIVSSGHVGDTVMTNFRQYGFHDALAKPYSIEEIGRKLIDITGSS